MAKSFLASYRTATIAAALLLACFVGQVLAYPEPSPYPIAWEYDFDYESPQRIIVDVPGEGPTAYWYMLYSVTNNTDEERIFLPRFEMVTREGKVIRSDVSLPAAAFRAVKTKSRNPELKSNRSISQRELLLGEDQMQFGVAIWQEPLREMGQFDIFVGGLSGEATALEGIDGEPIMNDEGRPLLLRKNLRLTYKVPGDDVYAGDPVTLVDREWVMR